MNIYIVHSIDVDGHEVYHAFRTSKDEAETLRSIVAKHHSDEYAKNYEECKKNYPHLYTRENEWGYEYWLYL